MAEVIPLARLNALLVEDIPSDAEHIRVLLESFSPPSFMVHHVPSISTAIRLISEREFHVVLLDLSLPDAVGLEGLRRIQHMAPTLPVVILTGRDDEKLALSAVREGAQDYLTKDSLSRDDVAVLLRCMHYAVQRKQLERGLIRQANYDKLTGLANRPLFESRLEMAVARSRRTEHGIGVFFIDLNDFKQVNDTLGHAAGDRVLQEAGKRIAQSVRPYDTVARVGGDEFAVLVEGIGSSRDCAAIAKKFLDLMAAPIVIDDRQALIGASIGIATTYGQDKPTAEALLKQADEAMYRAKGTPQGAYQFYTSDMQEEMRVRLELEDDLRMAIRNEELSLCYQPRQALETGCLGGLEALVRWNHPRRGLLLPGEFLAIAEETRMMHAVGEWVFAMVCKDIQRWQNMGLPLIQVSVNVSAQQLDMPDFAKFCHALVTQYGVPRSCLALEVPEAMFATLNARHEQLFMQLREAGIPLFMDQFGCGASSLLTLRSALLSVLKLDMRFTQGMENNAEQTRLVHAVIACAHMLGLTVVASGVESEWLRACLKDQQCDEIQGFIFSRPMPSSFLEGWLKTRKPLPPQRPAKRPQDKKTAYRF